MTGMDTKLAPLAPLSEVISKRRRDALLRCENRSMLRSTLGTVLFLAAALVVFFLFFRFHIVVGNEMFPSLTDGDLTLCYKVRELKKNDIVFYEADGETHCGRVVAKGGDRIMISADGTFFVNGTVQENEIIFPTYPRGEEDYSAEVPEGTVFVLGDFRTETLDSRDFGCIPIEVIDKKVIALIRHRKF